MRSGSRPSYGSYGLLESSFRPQADLVALRTLLRHRAQLLEHRAPHILHMQKAMLQMNVQLSQALSDITGETGMAIIRAIVSMTRELGIEIIAEGIETSEQLRELKELLCEFGQGYLFSEPLDVESAGKVLAKQEK